MSSCVASCCTCCPRLSSHPPLRLARQRQPQVRHRHRARASASAGATASRRRALIRVAPGPPSCADTAARRCSSSRPSRALSTSVARQVLRPHHDRQRSIDTTSPAALPPIVPSRTPLASFCKTLPLPTRHRLLNAGAATCLARHRHRSITQPDYLRLTSYYRRSNPHRSATLLIGISTSPRFPPSALARRPPSHLSTHASIRVHRQTTSNP